MLGLRSDCPEKCCPVRIAVYQRTRAIAIAQKTAKATASQRLVLAAASRFLMLASAWKAEKWQH
jgi:hypothetical protein